MVADWQRRLDLKDVWDSGDIHLIARTIAERLEKLMPFGEEGIDDRKAELVAAFKGVETDDGATAEDIDDIITDLYDWADTPIGPRQWNGKKVCWVATS